MTNWLIVDDDVVFNPYVGRVSFQDDPEMYLVGTDWLGAMEVANSQHSAFSRVHDDYALSNRGLLFSLKWGKVRAMTIPTGRYTKLALNGNRIGYTKLVAETFLYPTYRKGMIAVRTDGKDWSEPLDARMVHWMTRSDAAKYWRMADGSRNGRSKLSDEDVNEMLYLHKEQGRTVVELAESFNVHVNTVSNIINGRTWSNVTDDNERAVDSTWVPVGWGTVPSSI